MIVILVVIVVWVLIIYQTRRRAGKRRDVWKVEGENLQTPGGAGDEGEER